MTNAPDLPATDFTLRDALDATRGWDDDSIELDDQLLEEDDEFESGYADEPSDYDDDRTPRSSRSAPRSSPSATRCAASPACAPSSRTSPRSSTASCASSGSCWSACGPTAPSTDAENSMAELALLAETAGSEVLEAVFQRRQTPDPATYIGRGKVEAIREIVPGDRRRHRHLRRRARAQPAAQPRGQAQGQGRRPDRADPRHLRPAREVQGGPGAGRAGPAAVHEAAPARLGRQPVPPGRWPCRRR